MEGEPAHQGAQGEYLTDRLTDEAVKFIRTNREKPFFLYLAHYAVHVPIEAKEELVRKYRAKLKPGQLQNDPIYAAMIQSMDESVGRILSALGDVGLTDRTVVIFTSDNGGLSAPEWKLKPVTSNSPLREGKGHVYEGGIREPLIVSWPGVKSRVEETPVCSIDLLPTFAEAAGASASTYKGIDGVSLVALIRDQKPIADRSLYWHYPHYSNQLGKPAALFGTVTISLLSSMRTVASSYTTSARTSAKRTISLSSNRRRPGSCMPRSRSGADL